MEIYRLVGKNGNDYPINENNEENISKTWNKGSNMKMLEEVWDFISLDDFDLDFRF